MVQAARDPGTGGEVVSPSEVVHAPAPDQAPAPVNGTGPRGGAPDARTIDFPETGRARAVEARDGDRARDLIKALGITPGRSVIVLAGGAAKLDDALTPRLAQLFARGVARAAVQADALVVDGGTHAGIMALMGQALADRGAEKLLLGVAPSAKVGYPGGPSVENIPDGAQLDPNHGMFVLAEGEEWGAETDTLFAIADVVAAPNRVVTVLVDGGPGARREVLRSIRRGWPVVVIEGTGRLAEDIAQLRRDRGATTTDSELAEIVADGNIRLFPLDAPVAELERLLLRYLTDVTPLRLAWERFAQYDTSAAAARRSFELLQFWIVALGVLGTVLALTLTQLRQMAPAFETSVMGAPTMAGLRYGVILVPLVISVLLAALTRGKQGSRWVLLRAGAEAIKREIFRYRTRSGIYSTRETRRLTPEEKLARQIDRITRRLMQTEVNASGLRLYSSKIPPPGSGAAHADDGLSVLTPDRYVAFRLVDQLQFYRTKAQRLSQQLTTLQWLMLCASGAGTFLAAVGLELWVALTGALVTALAGLLQYRQVEQTLVKYNQAETNLANLRAWWVALPPDEQVRPERVDRLVDTCEDILQAEHAGWVQQMQDALAALHDEDDRRSERQGVSPNNGDAEPARKRGGQ